jgi:hypothetical protein
MKTYVHLWQYLAELFLEWEMFQANVVEKIKNTFYVEYFFKKIVPFVRKCCKVW